MPTPPKPFKVLTSEKKSHRTKAELKKRQEGEKSLSTDIELKERKEEFYRLVFELKEEMKSVTDNMEDVENIANYKLEYAKSIAKIMSSMNAIDKQIQSKRKMLLDIEKENVMTIASALRCIPKKEDKEANNPLLKVLRGEA